MMYNETSLERNSQERKILSRMHAFSVLFSTNDASLTRKFPYKEEIVTTNMIPHERKQIQNICY